MERYEIDLERRAEIGRERRARTRAQILGAAFELFGEEGGLYARIEEIAAKAGVTRATFYNHFAGMAELRDALTYELTHDFLTAVSLTILELADPRAKSAVAFRFYLHRARADRSWAWSILNISANGVLFGAETQRHAQETVRQGMEAGVLVSPMSELGRDLILGTAIAAIAAMLREDLPEDYPESVAEHVLRGLGVPADEARSFARMPMPRLTSIRS